MDNLQLKIVLRKTWCRHTDLIKKSDDFTLKKKPLTHFICDIIMPGGDIKGTVWKKLFLLSCHSE